MENLRAYMIANSLKECELDFNYYPADMESNPDSCQTIVENGFFLTFSNRETAAQAEDIIKSQNHIRSYELLDMFTSLLNLTVIENAPQTNELLSSFIAYIKYKYSDKGTFVSIGEEVEQAERYLTFQQKKLGDRLRFSIQIPKDIYIQKMPRTFCCRLSKMQYIMGLC